MKISIVILLTLSCFLGKAQVAEGVLLPSLSEDEEIDCYISNIPDNPTVCENESVEFQISGSNFDELAWFTSENLQTPVEYGNRFNTGGISETATYYVQATCPYQSNQRHVLETMWRGENGKEGIMFSLHVKESINLQSFDIHINIGCANCHVFMMEGDYVQYANNPGVWTSIYDGMLDGKGKNKPVMVDIQDVELEPGVYGFYLSLEDDDLLYYSTGTTVFQDDYLIIGNSKGVAWPFSNLCGNRIFNGRLNYSVGEKPKSVQYEITANVIDKPNAPVVNCVGNLLSVNQDGEFLWYYNGNEIQNETQSDLHPSKSGFYSVAKQIDQCVGYESNLLYYAMSDYDEFPIQPEFYPNPVQNTLNVNTHNFRSGKLQITNARGKLLYEEDFVGQQFLNLDFSNYSTGQYSISLILENECFSQIILKQ